MRLAVTHIIDAHMGGAEQALANLLATQKSKGLAVDCIIITQRHNQDLIAQYRATGAKVTPIIHQPDRLPGRPLAKLCILRQLLKHLSGRRRHILHLHLYLAAQMGRLAATMLGCPYVVETIHGRADFFSSRKWQALMLPLMRKKTSCYITVSQAMADYVQTVFKAQAVVIPNGMPAGAACLSQASARKTLGLERDDFILGFVGRLAPEKNISTLLRALTLVEQAKLVIVGQGQLQGQLENEVKQLGLERRVIFTGHIPQAWPLLPAFNALCLPSYHEGNPVVLLEAMHCQVPIIASNIEGNRETLKNGAMGFLHEVENAPELARLIEKIRLEFPGPMVRAAQAWVGAQYSMDNTHNQLLTLYQKVMGR